MVNKSTLAKKLSSYSALATVVVTATQKADGQIIYHAIKPDTVLHTTSSYVLDLNGNGVSDFQLFEATSIVTSSNRVLNEGGILANPGNGVERNSIESLATVAQPNSYNKVIGSSDAWLVSAGLDYCSLSKYKNHGVFAGKGDKYIGLRLSSGGKIYYGWVRVNFNAKCDSLIIKDYAYNATAGASIEAGQGKPSGIDDVTADAANFELLKPNPASTMATVVYSLNVTGMVTLELFDVMGHKIETLLNNTNQSIGRYTVTADVNKLCSGIYFYRLTFNGQKFTQKLFVMHY